MCEGVKLTTAFPFRIVTGFATSRDADTSEIAQRRDISFLEGSEGERHYMGAFRLTPLRIESHSVMRAMIWMGPRTPVPLSSISVALDLVQLLRERVTSHIVGYRIPTLSALRKGVLQ